MAKKKPTTPPPAEPEIVQTSKAVTVRQNHSLSLANIPDIMGFSQVLKQYIVENNLSVKIEGNDYAKVDAWKFAGMNFGLTGIPAPPIAMHLPGQMIVVMIAPLEYVKQNGATYMKDTVIYGGPLDNQPAIESTRLYVAENKIKITREIVRPFYSYKCQCDVVRISGNKKVSFGEGLCSNLEENKLMAPEYSINSHAQTRSIGKGLRNLLGFVMSSAGYQGTPAEEMDGLFKTDEAFHEKEKGRAVPTSLPILAPEDEGKALAKVEAGEWSVEFLKGKRSLTPNQVKALQLAEADAKAAKKGQWGQTLQPEKAFE